jgi:hypothetical protein
MCRQRAPNATRLSDLQTFLSLPHLVSKASNEEIDVEKVGSEGKFNRKSIIFTARTDEIIKMQSIGDVGVGDIKGDVAYRKEKEKQALNLPSLPNFSTFFSSSSALEMK